MRSGAGHQKMAETLCVLVAIEAAGQLAAAETPVGGSAEPVVALCGHRQDHPDRRSPNWSAGRRGETAGSRGSPTPMLGHPPGFFAASSSPRNQPDGALCG